MAHEPEPHILLFRRPLMANNRPGPPSEPAYDQEDQA